MMRLLPFLCAPLLALSALPGHAADSGDWKPLFNGENLDGWTAKISGHPSGENFADTFRAEEGSIRVRYDDYDTFDGRFGHLFTDIAYARYHLRLEYKLTGERMPDAPSWTERNSGVMLHAQPPQSMQRDQDFPVSLEGQFLAAIDSGERPTGNLCTPGTHVVFNDRFTTQHIITADAPTIPLDVWVRFEAVVDADKEIIYSINGEEVLRFEQPQLDPDDADAARLLEAGANLKLGFGHIALQAEGHPVAFRNIEIRPLP